MCFSKVQGCWYIRRLSRAGHGALGSCFGGIGLGSVKSKRVVRINSSVCQQATSITPCLGSARFAGHKVSGVNTLLSSRRSWSAAVWQSSKPPHKPSALHLLIKNLAIELGVQDSSLEFSPKLSSSQQGLVTRRSIRLCWELLKGAHQIIWGRLPC